VHNEIAQAEWGPRVEHVLKSMLKMALLFLLAAFAMDGLVLVGLTTVTLKPRDLPWIKFGLVAPMIVPLWGVFFTWLYCRPLPRRLRTEGVPAHAIVREATFLGKGFTTTAGVGPVHSRSQSGFRLRRKRYRLEVRASTGTTYSVTLVTYDGPSPESTIGRELTVYVDRTSPKHLFPDWSTLEAVRVVA
jgi:hypothetical protein